MRRRITVPLVAAGAVAATLTVVAGAQWLTATSPRRPAARRSVPPVRSRTVARIQFEPQSAEAPKGSKECNGGVAAFPELNNNSLPWKATNVGRSATFNWVLTARHRTATWVYYVEGGLPRWPRSTTTTRSRRPPSRTPST